MNIVNSIENVMKISMENARDLVDADTIIGTPFSLPDGSLIIPVSRVGMGLISGGADIPTKTPVKTSAEGIFEYPFAGTSAVGMSLSPVSFIVYQGSGVKLLPISYNSPLERLIDTLLPAINKLTDALKKGE